MLDYVDKRLSPDQAASAEGASADGALTKEELLAALKTTLKGKSPGLDGLPYEFYLTFWDAVADALAAAVNEAYTADDAAPAYDAAFTEGIITLIYKGRPSAPLPEDAVSSYRPITLLNADYKVAAKAVTRRLSRVLGHVVDDTQTAFVPGRWIGDNILCHLDVFDAVASPDSACILFLDFEKAYDRVCRGWLAACMERMGVGPHARRWVRLIALQRLQEGRPGQEGRDEGEKEREQPPRARNPRPGSTGRVQLEPTLTLGCTAVRGAGRKRRRPHPNPRCNTQHAPHGRREGEQGWLRSKNTRRLAASCEVFKRKQAAHRTAGHARQQSARAHPKAGTDEQWPSNPQKTVAGR